MKDGKFTFTQPTDLDALELSMFMRVSDVMEIKALNGNDPLTAVEESIKASERKWTVRDINTGELICIYGFAKLTAIGGAAPWMLGTDLLDEHKKELLVRSRRALPHILKVYPYLWNVASADNTDTLLYLEWLGFTIGKTFTMPNGSPAREFRLMAQEYPHV